MAVVSEFKLPRAQKDLWQKAKNAVKVQNFEYVVSLVTPILQAEPNFLDGRRLLRKSCMQMQRAKGGGGKKGLKISTGGLSLMKIKPQIKKDPLAAIQALEEALEKDPTSSSANGMLYDAAMAADMPETAAFALETQAEGNPKDTEVLQKLAEHYMAQEEPSKALEAFNKILKINPSHLGAVRGVTEASARESMKKNNWEEGGNKRDDEERAKLEMAGRAHLTKEQIMDQLAEFAPQYEEDPNNLVVVKKIANLYERLEDWDNALVYFDWGHQISDGDTALEAKVVEIKEKKLTAEFTAMETEIESDPGAADIDEKRARLKELKKERLATKVVEAKDRVERNPTDPQLRFSYATLLYETEDFTAAIPELQRAKSNPHVRIKALLMLGKCFDKKNMLDMAVNQLDEADKELHGMDGTKKELLYEKGTILEKMGKKDEALEAFKLIYEADYGYLDVAQRVESSYS